MSDVIVVGAGSAGSVVARRLLDDGARVTVLEAGRADDNPAIHDLSRMGELWHGPDDWAYFTVPQRHALDRRVHWPRGKVLGGSHSLNASIYVRGAHGDYDRWEREGATGWGWDRVESWFRRIESATGGLLDVTDDYPRSDIMVSLKEAAVQAGIPDNPNYNGDRQEGVGWEQLTIRDSRRLSTYRAYLHPRVGDSHLTILTGAWVHRLLIEKGRVVGVQLERDGTVEELHADEVVLCGGALDSPRVLMLSGLGPAGHLRDVGVDVVADLPGVGGNLHDHLLVPVIGSARRPVAPPRESVPVTQVHSFTTFRSGSDVPDTQPIYFSVPMLGEGQCPPPNAFSILAGLVRPNSRGTLRLTSSDPHAPVAMDPDILDAPEDLESLLASVRQCRDILGQDAIARDWDAREVYPGPGVESTRDLVHYIRSQVTTYHHQVGTCRMGTDTDAVIDPATFRLNGGPSGVRVVDASLMPSVISGNTNAPSIMIAERGAAAMTSGPVRTG